MMNQATNQVALTVVDREALTRAVASLERSSLAIKIAGLVGQPVTRVIGKLPGVANRQLTRVIEAALFKCLTVAIDSLDGLPAAEPSRWVPRVTAGITGGVGGLFGALALPIELPLTTTFMLQSVADIARHNGEDLRTIESRLACLEVFALGDHRASTRADIGYYATRAVLVQMAADIAAFVIQRLAIDAGSPVVNRIVSELANRFGVAVSERAAATALPIIGALGGAAVNIAFMSHFQQIAEAHFTVRRLERHYGGHPIRNLYTLLLAESAPANVAYRS
jgi:hypothetical protein